MTRTDAEHLANACAHLRVLDALQSEIERVRQDEEFMGLLHSLVERDKEILDRLAE